MSTNINLIKIDNFFFEHLCYHYGKINWNKLMILLVLDAFEPIDDISTSLVFFFFGLLKLFAFEKFTFILSSITYLILLSSFFAEVNGGVFGLFKKFSLFPFKVMKQLFLLLINILFNAVFFVRNHSALF